MSTDHSRVGIIGAGGVSTYHHKGYTQHGADVVAIADVNSETLAKRKEEWGNPEAFTDYRELLEMDQIEAVSVCVPNALHHPITIAAARAGKHVLCEKPISLSIALSDDMISTCRDAGVILQIGHHLRSDLNVRKAREIIDSGRLGRLTYLRLRQAHDWGGAPEVTDTFGKKNLAGGGTLLDNGCHMFDLLRFLGGEVEEVFGRIGTLKYNIEVEDTAMVSARLASGAMASVEASWTATGWEEGFWIYGTKGALSLTNMFNGSVKPVLHHKHREGGENDWSTYPVDEYDFSGSLARPESLGHFLAAIAGREPVVCSGEDGREAVRLILASYASAASGQPIRIADFKP